MSESAVVAVSPFVAALPKVELHLHLVGSASPETVLELSRRHPDAGLPVTLEAMRELYVFRDFPHFIENYVAIATLVRSADDIAALVLGLAADAAASNVRYAEVTVSPSAHFAAGTAPAELSETLAESRKQAQERYGVTLNWIFDIISDQGDQAAWETVAFAVRDRPEGTVALGLAGPEVGFGRGQFHRQFTVAREAGLHSVVHAGETTGPAAVWSAVTELGAERIGHGIGSVTDPRLLARLRSNGITLEVCPTSNLLTRAVRRIEEHPLPRLMQHGVPVTLSTDDPGMFNTTLNREYQLVADTFGVREGELAELARTGVRAAYCDPELRTRLMAEIDSVRPED